MSLNINNLKQNKNEILKAEIVSLFSLLEKTFTEWWKGKGFFKTFTNQHNVTQEIDNLLSSLQNISIELHPKINNNVYGNSLISFNDFINRDWRQWRNINLNNNPEKFLQVLYGSCEGINSGIEKGSPSENNKISKFSDKPCLTNSFGTFKNTVSYKELNKLRELLFNKDLNNLDKNYKNNIYNKKILQKNISTILSNLSVNTSIWNIISSRIRIYNLIKILYSAIPSDSRFPANDTSLFDQAYMATSLFKASLAGFILRSNGNEIDITNFDHTKIKWSILGIQYDKLRLAEKGLKVASIKWYRDTANQVDNKIKRIIEIEYALGNEVYRDETGIYFVVGENIKGDKEGDFYNLNSDLNELKEETQKVFSDKIEGEIYPAIFLTEPSRGLMNLGYLIEKAKENFLKAEYPSDFETQLKDDSEPDGICQVCGMRLAKKENKENLICDVCLERLKGRIKEWLNNIDDETIWLDELQDKNGRVALITLKFELEKWINGDMVNSLVIQNIQFPIQKGCNDINSLLADIITGLKQNKKLNNTCLKDYHINIPNIKLQDLAEKWFLERSIGSKWEEFIKNNLSNETAIDFEKRKIFWDKLNDQDIVFLASLIFQFLLRKNPSPARLRRIWESTKEFFKNMESRIIELSGISKERSKRLVWYNVGVEDGEYEDGDIVFWAHNKTVYLITSIEKVKNKNEFKLKKRDENNSPQIKLNIDSAKEIDYKPYFTILSPTPISWQFIIPAENFPTLIKNIQEEYYKNFKWIYGKLPLHIGVIVQNYKSPIYIGIKALRKIRRDKVNWKNLKIGISEAELKARQKKALTHQEPPEKNSQCENFYSLYEKISGTGKYEFYLYPDKNKVWLDTTQNYSDTDKFNIYPNTIDFELLDTNARRNDIFYKKGKRVLKLKSNRPYDLYSWQYFEKFKDYFFSDKKSSSKLQKLVSVIYSKLEDWNNEGESLKVFMLSAFVNILELRNEEQENEFANAIGVEKFEKFRTLSSKEFGKKLLMILDMFDFWHTMLKYDFIKMKKEENNGE